MSKENLNLFWEIVPALRCNFRCLNCYAAENARPDARLLDWCEMEIALEKAVALGAKKIDILGGEPLTYRHLEKFIECFKSRVIDGFCGVVSNGSLITKRRARSLLDSGIDQLSISIDGTSAEINNANRGKGTFERILIGTGNAREAGIPLIIAYTVTPFNTLDTPNLFPFVQRLGAKAISVQTTEMTGRARETLAHDTLFNRIEGLKAICRMYIQRPPLYTEIATRSLFKEFLNQFFNAGLDFPELRCGGGLKTFMVSSGGDLYPCSEYAYFPDGKIRNKGVNLISDSLKTIEEFVENEYSRFNVRMRLLETQKFTTCQDCKYRFSCAPCPLANPEGTVPECEWVKSQTKQLTNKILHSRVRILIEPTKYSKTAIEFSVPTQNEPLIVPMSDQEFREFMNSGSVARIVEGIREEVGDTEKVRERIIEFFCKLRSHKVIDIEEFESFL